ncbi:MAG TPA: DUF748 domain-containing protein [Opitutaceae bacterium]
MNPAAGRFSPVLRFLRRWSRRTLYAAAIVVVIALAVRAAAPVLLREAINRRLAAIEGFRGTVADVDLYVWRGAYQLEDLRLTRLVNGMHEPFVAARAIDFSLAWRELFRGRVLSDIVATGVTMAYVPTPEKAAATPFDAPPWQDVIQDIFPIDITRLVVHDGRLAYLDDRVTPVIDIALEKLELVATGLRNRAEDTGGELPAHIALSGTSVGGGLVRMQIAAAPLAARPRFEADFELTGVSLPALNDYLRAYGGVDVSQGTMQLFAEMTARDGRFEGYVKPFFDDVAFAEVGPSDKGLANLLWERVVAGVVTLFKNKERDQLGTRIPFQGEVGDPRFGLWQTFVNLFRHGFIRALTERLETEAEPGPGKEAKDTDRPAAPPPRAGPRRPGGGVR